ncbi:MAG TPA: hypothetical protein VFA87_04245 [Rhizomicrobium sp.]|nr:hypothetical protein [Rhizomicrobium sp.]
MKLIWMAAIGATALVSLGGAADAFTHHPSTPAERAQTKALNEQQLQLAKQENTGLAINANSAAAQQIEAEATNAPASDTRSGR